MKKLLMTIAIVLGLGMSTFAQENMQYEEKGLFGKGDMTKDGIFNGLMLPEMGDNTYTTNENQDAPLGTGIAVLMGLGAAYLVGKKRKED